MAEGIGNYKGVMLCNRPFAGTEGTYILIKIILVTATANPTSKTESFVTGKVGSPLGIGESQVPYTLNTVIF